MKIAYILKSFPEISQTFIIVQLTELIESGHDVTIFAQNRGNDNNTIDLVKKHRMTEKCHFCIKIPKNKNRRRIKALIFSVIKLMRHPLKTVAALRILFSQKFDYENLFFFLSFKPEKFDILQCHFGPAGNIGLFTKETGLFEGKLVTTFHGYDVSSYIKLKNESVYDKLFRTGDAFTYNSEATKDKLIALGCNEDKMFKLPMGIPVEDFKFKRRNINPDSQINILSVGRLVEMKGRKYAIEAISKLVNDYPNIKYYIVGNGPCLDTLKAQVNRLNLSSIIEFTGWVSSKKLMELYDKCHIFLHPSITASDGNQEGQGMVLIEAQAQGIPVIATRHNAFTETIIEDVTGFLVEEKNAMQISEKIKLIIEKPDIPQQMVFEARRHLEDLYCSKILNVILLSLYTRLIDGKN